MRALSVLSFALVAALGCSSTEYHATLGVTQVTQNISVAWGERGPSDDVRFDDPRLARAVEETAALIGHRVQFRFDLTLMPRPIGQFFDALFEHYIGRIPRDLERLSSRDADVFAYGRERLRAIHFDYDGSVVRPALTFDAPSGVLRIQMNGTSELIEHGVVSYALDRSFRDYLQETFRAVEVAQVPAPQLRFYLRYLDNVSGDREVRAAVLSRAIAVHDRARSGPTELRDRVRAFILRRFDMLGYERVRNPNEVAALPPSSSFHVAERDLARFVRESWNDLTDAQRKTLIDAMFVRRMRGGRGEEDPFMRDTYPGVDLMALSLDVVDRWMAAGRPNPDRMGRDDHAQSLYDFVVCPPRARAHTGYDRGQCYSVAYDYITTDPALRPRFFDAILARQNTELTEALFANLAWLDNRFLLEAWRHFENDATQWRAATRVIADRVQTSPFGHNENELYDDCARVWRQRAPERGALLYVLASLDYPGGAHNYTVRWAEFARIFGSLASRQDLDSYLNHGDAALVRIPVIVPALAAGVHIIDALRPHLDRSMADDAVRRRFHYFPYETLRDLVAALRDRRDTANLTALRRYLEGRIPQHPSEQRWIETLLQMISR